MDEFHDYSDVSDAEASIGATVGDPGSKQTHEANAYPDPEDIPSYPWLGSNVVNEGSGFRKPSSTPLSPAWALQVSEDDSNSIGHPTEEQIHAGFDRNDPSADPDFHCSGDNLTSDDPFSEADSEPRPSSPRRRGRRPGRAGVRRQPNQRASNSRGRGGHRRARGGPGIKRGPRKPLEPNPEFKALQSQAAAAFIAHNYDQAEDLALQAINLNPEMFAAHSLLSEIHMARGDRNKATAALFNGAHTRPGDTQVWLRVKTLLLERDANDMNSLIPDAIYCLTRVLNIQPKNIEIRYERASLNRKLGYLGRAANEYEQLLKLLPHDVVVLRHLAEVYVELGDVDRALERYEESIAYHQTREPASVSSFSWSDVNVYTELYGYDGQYDIGIRSLKSLSRWLQGRSQECIWENFSTDDREWDLEDQPRRILVDGFVPGAFPSSAYGRGLPLELRIKLGVYRLNLEDTEEAIAKDDREDAKLFDYPDLFREAADALRTHGLYHEALTYYEPLHTLDGFGDPIYLCDMAFCYWRTGLLTEAEDCYEEVVESGDASVDLRHHLAEMCKETCSSDRIKRLLEVVNDVTTVCLKGNEAESPGEQIDVERELAVKPSSMLAPRSKGPTLKPSLLERERREREQEQREQERDGRIADQYTRLQQFNAGSREGDAESRLEWMSAAQILIQDFRSNSIFYPTDRYMKFFGYTSEARAISSASRSTRAALGFAVQGDSPEREIQSVNRVDSTMVPQEYRGIRFDTWLDIFLEYATMQAQQGHLREAYDTITAAWNANVFCHSTPSSLLIHVCWFTCALLWNDEETLSNVSRWFMQEYQFTTDAYRLTAAVHRLCNAATTWYNCAPTQKYLLRQLKAMDFPLVSESQRLAFPSGRAGYTTRDESGNPIMATDMDVALLMLYGHILYCGRTFTAALNYFFRAYALNPGSPMINLSIALSYLHHAFKRQSDSRHHLIMQGFAFLSAYYDLRKTSTTACERQEADYNVARAFHMLGLTHLAIPCYQRCLGQSKAVHTSCPHEKAEGFTREAAYALQGLWAMDGESERARQLSEAWLVI